MGHKAVVRAVVVAASTAAATLVAPPASAQSVDWVRQLGSTDRDEVFDVATDASGNVYAAGRTFGSLPGKTSAGDGDAFVAKYDAAGTQVWVRQLGTAAWDEARSVATDGSGHVIVGGWTAGALAGQSSARQPSAGSDAFVAKLDASGNTVWLRQLGSIKSDEATAVATDGSGSVVVAGWTAGALAGQTSSGSHDGFVAKYDASGAQQWVRQLGTSSVDRVLGAATDPFGNVVIAGRTESSLGGPHSGWADAFVAKYDSAGGQEWVAQVGTAALDEAVDVDTDSSGNVLVAGWTFGMLPGQTSTGGPDGFVTKYSPSGTALWLRQFGSPERDEAMAIAVDDSGSSYVAGGTYGAFPGQTYDAYGDAFVVKHDATGAAVWTHQFGNDDFAQAFGIAIGPSRNIYLGGWTTGTFAGETYAGGNSDGFVARMTQPSTGAEQSLTDLQAQVTSLGAHAGTTQSLQSKLQAALTAIAAGDVDAACGALKAFINQVGAQAGKKLTPAQAQQLIDDAEAIRTALGC